MGNNKNSRESREESIEHNIFDFYKLDDEPHNHTLFSAFSHKYLDQSYHFKDSIEPDNFVDLTQVFEIIVVVGDEIFEREN